RKTSAPGAEPFSQTLLRKCQMGSAAGAKSGRSSARYWVLRSVGCVPASSPALIRGPCRLWRLWQAANPSQCTKGRPQLGLRADLGQQPVAKARRGRAGGGVVGIDQIIALPVRHRGADDDHLGGLKLGADQEVGHQAETD